MIRVLLLILLLMPACGMTQRQMHAQTANAIAAAANGALPILLRAYEQEGNIAIARAETESEARAAIADIKKAWAPVWEAWETLRVAQDAWAGALEEGGDAAGALKKLNGAYCGLESVWPRHIPAMPLGPMQCPNPNTPKSN